MTLPSGLIGGFLWRFAWAMRPFAANLADYLIWCHDHGIVGQHLPENGRCTTCKREIRP